MKFSAVFVFDSQVVECPWRHLQQEVVGEDGVVILEDAGYLSLALSYDVHVYGIHPLYVRLREVVEEFGKAEVSRYASDGYSEAASTSCVQSLREKAMECIKSIKSDCQRRR